MQSHKLAGAGAGAGVGTLVGLILCNDDIRDD